MFRPLLERPSRCGGRPADLCGGELGSRPGPAPRPRLVRTETGMRRAVIVLAAGCVLSAGCRTPSTGPYPPDPLVLARKPLPASARPAGILPPLAAAEPAPPPVPNDLASTVPNPLPREPDSAAVRTVAHRTETQAREPEYGSDPHLHWLQGKLEKGADGRFELCYRRPSLDAPVGKVQLEDDVRLTAYGDGDAVRVEGVLVPSLALAEETSSPRYKITAVSRLSPAP